MRQAIALATSVVTLWGMWVIGNHSWKGWAIGLGNQALWLLFIVSFGAWGLLPLSLALIVTYTRNLLRWRRESIVVLTTPDPSTPPTPKENPTP